MFDRLTPPPADKIIRLMAMFAADTRPGKVDLGVGVYRDTAGRTPVMAAVKVAERVIWETQDSKGYVGFVGEAGFLEAMRNLILGEEIDAARVGACATPGGTGAVRQILEAVKGLQPETQVWVPSPSWPNHAAIIDHLRMPRRGYRYYDAGAGGIDLGGMLTDLSEARRGDLVLLHGCCHNPTGADLREADWRAIADVLNATGAIPFVDIAYQGFGDGLEADAAGLRYLAAQVPEMLIAASASKNFGLYRERVGIALAVTAGGVARDAATGLLAHMNRLSFSFPPDHGARIVMHILQDDALRAMWQTELEQMRQRMAGNRMALAQALRAATGSDRFGFVAAQKGMFSIIGITPTEVDILRNDHAIYVVEDGRMNFAGLTEASVPIVARAIAGVAS